MKKIQVNKFVVDVAETQLGSAKMSLVVSLVMIAAAVVILAVVEPKSFPTFSDQS